MSFLSDVFSGNFSNLGNDLAPSNVFSDFGSDAMKVLSNPVADIGIGAAIALPFLAPEIGAALGGGAAALDVGGITAAGLGGDLSGLTAADVSYLDPTLTAADFTSTADAALPSTSTLASGVSDIAFGPNTSTFSSSGLPLTQGGVIDTTAPGMPSSIGDPSIYNYGATAAAPATSGQSGILPTLTGDVGTIGDTGATPLTGPEFSIPSPANPSAGGQFGFGAGQPGGNPLTNALSGVGNFLGSPAGRGATAVAGLGGLGYNLYQGYQTNKANKALTAQEQALATNAADTAAAAKHTAQPLLTSGDTLMSYLTNNTLPPQFQSAVDQQVAAAKAGIIQGYASRGMSANPEQNSALAQDLANVDQQALTLKGNLESTLSTAGNQMVQTANQLLSTGLSATDLAAQIPIAMSKLNITLNASMASAISNFAAALNGGNRGGGGITLQLPQNVIGSNANLNLQ